MADLQSFPPRETTFVTFYLLNGTPSFFWKGEYSKRKYLAPFGSTLLPVGAKSFLLMSTSFQNGAKTILKELPPFEIVLIPLNRFPR